MTAERRHRIAERLADANRRSEDAARQGDYDGARYAKAEAAKLRRILAEG